MTKEEAACVLDLMACDISAAEKEEGYTYERWELREALEIAIEALRRDDHEY